MTNSSKAKKGFVNGLVERSRQMSDLILGGSLAGQTAQQAAQRASDNIERIPNFDADYVGVEMLLSSAGQPVRTRSQIYTKYNFMVNDGLINTALRLKVQMALGGHETTGETIFLEPKPEISPSDKKLVEELAPLVQMFNDSAHSMCFNAAGFGDAYARIYTEPKVGIVAFDHETLWPPLVQPYEELGRTVGYVVSYGEKLQTHMDHLGIVRLKMPRMQQIPQMRVIENAQKINIEALDITKMVPLPALVGGSMLSAAEFDFDNLYAAIRGLTGQRVAASIDETIIAANMADMTAAQQVKHKENLRKMFTEMKDRAEEQVKSGIYSTARHFHVLPVWGDKQLTQISSMQGAANSGVGANIDDVMFHAKKLGGTMGIDISMIGFADLLTGGLGDGGLNRTSASAAESARMIRTAYTRMANDAIDRHMLAKYGDCWPDAKRPYTINFYGSIAALEGDKQASAERAMNKAAIMLQAFAQMRDLGLDQKANEHILAKQMELDQDAAELYAKALANAKPPAPPGGEFGGGGNDLDLIPPAGAANENDEGQGNA